MAGGYILALDCGTTSGRGILFDRSGRICSMAQKEFMQHYPNPGWVEHDCGDILDSAVESAREAMAKIGASAADIAAIGITNQRETTVVWNKHTGKCVYNAIVWQCRRTSSFCDRLIQDGLSDIIKSRTGLVIDAYFSGTKIRWILDNVPGARKDAEAGNLLFGTVETFIIWKLTCGRVHVTDYSNASRTMLFDINKLDWDDEILKILGIPRSMLPKPVSSSQIYGMTDSVFFGAPIAIGGAAGDQQCALFGQTCFLPGQVKNTYGTGCFLLMNTGEKPVFSGNGLVTTVAWGLNGKVSYALEGSVFVAGAAVQWLRDELGIIKSSAESESLASSVKDTNGCFFVPAFTGLGAPYWDQYARGTIVGLTRGVNKCHIARAVLESIAFQVNDLLISLENDFSSNLLSLNVDGGASANNLLMQMQADISQIEVRRPSCLESTALGAAYLAGLSSGFWNNTDDILGNCQNSKCFEPLISKDDAGSRVKIWKKAVERSFRWAQ